MSLEVDSEDLVMPLVGGIQALLSKLQPPCEEPSTDIQSKLDNSLQKPDHMKDAVSQLLKDIVSRVSIEEDLRQYLSLSSSLDEKLTKLEKTSSEQTLHGLDKQQIAQVSRV